MAKPQQIRDHIAYFLQEAVKAYDIEAVCDRLGMPAVDDAWTYNSKRVYVQNRLAGVPAADLIQIAGRVIEEFDDPELEQLLEGGGYRGVDGALKNIIFAADGAKPRIVVSDALNNTIDIVEGADRCLIFDRPLPAGGLTWTELVDWWASLRGVPNDRAAATSLYKRLARSLASPPEELLFKTYCERYAGDDPGIPAMIPQVYLHYSPYTARELAAMNGTELPRQRMDFLLLPAERTRIVVEVDGKQHYATDDGAASPPRYADMVREDRRIRLNGYEVFRFGGAELQGAAGERLVREFFDKLIERTRAQP
jgi:very-short-patch-repair endonuclease